jgi:microcystin-dependent protein
LINVVESLEPPDRGDDTQLLRAIQALVNVVVNQEINQKFDSFDPMPVGSVISFMGLSAPEGYLLCNGQTFSQSAYPKLYALLGRTTVPDMRGMFLRMTGGNAAELGQKQLDAAINLTGIIGSFRGFEGFGTNIHVGSAIRYIEYSAAANKLKNSGSAGKALANITLDASWCWGEEHIANEFRPVNMSVNYIIKHD